MSNVAIERLRVSPSEAAEMLGVSLPTIWAYVETRQLVPIAPRGRGPGKRVYFDIDEIKAFAKGGPEAAKRYRAKRDRE